MKENVFLFKFWRLKGFKTCVCLPFLFVILNVFSGYAESKKTDSLLADHERSVTGIHKKAATIEQQQMTIQGKVTDEIGEPLPGVTIVVDGTTRGVITDVDGTYSIEAKPDDKLVFSYIGMENQTINVNSKTRIDVVLSEKIDELEEVTIV